MLTDIKIISGNWNNGEYKYNVQLLYNNTYCGKGHFTRTYNEALKYIKETI